MALTVANIITDLREHLGVSASSPRWTDARCLDFINRSFWEIHDKIPFQEKQMVQTLPTVIGQELLTSSLAGQESIRNLSILDDQTGTFDELDKWDDYSITHDRSENELDRGRPERYWILTGNIYLWPVPDAVYDVRVQYNAELTDLTTSPGTITFPRVWGEIILYGAIWRSWKSLNDYERLNGTRAIQVSLIQSTESKEEKEKSQNHRSSFQVYRPRYRS